MGILSLVEMHVRTGGVFAPAQLVDVWRGSLKRAPGVCARRSGPVVRPNVDRAYLVENRDFCKAYVWRQVVAAGLRLTRGRGCAGVCALNRPRDAARSR